MKQAALGSARLTGSATGIPVAPVMPGNPLDPALMAQVVDEFMRNSTINAELLGQPVRCWPTRKTP